jgi:hypothetical protein
LTLDRFAEQKPELCDRDLYIVQLGLDLRWHGLLSRVPEQNAAVPLDVGLVSLRKQESTVF